MTATKGETMEYRFRELDDLVLHLKGLVLVRGLRERDGADASELEMFDHEIDRVRDRLPVTSGQVSSPSSTSRRNEWTAAIEPSPTARSRSSGQPAGRRPPSTRSVPVTM